MTLTRYQIRNEYGLGDKELYRAANKDDSEALLEGASMAGLVGVLRQLGDLSEFAAEVFHCLHEEVMTTAARGHRLAMRLQQLEAEFPSVEIPILSLTDHSNFFSDPGLEWHSNIQPEENLISPRNLPHCIMDSYEECRGPPQLFLLDKFDVAGSGSCLKRYSDPSSLKTHTASVEIATSILGKDERPRKPKKIASPRIGKETPEASKKSHAKLHHLFSLEHVENGHRNPEINVKLKRRQLTGPPIYSSSGTGYMEKFLKTSSPYCERVHGTVDHSSPAVETEVTVCSVQEDLPIPSIVYPVNGDTRQYNDEREMESIPEDERREMAFVPHEIMVNEKYLPNDSGAPASTESETKEVDSDLGFPGFGQTEICGNTHETQIEILAQFSNVLHHSLEEGESSLVCSNLQRSSRESKLYKAQGSAVEVGVSMSQPTPDESYAGMGTPDKENADEIGLTSSEACELVEVGDTMLDVSPENHVGDHHSQHVSSMETESEISLSTLVEDQVSSIAIQEIEALDPKDNSSDCLLPNQYTSTLNNFEELSMAGDAHDNVAPKEDETNSQDGSSMNTKQSGHVSTLEISSENEMQMSDTHTGNGNLSASRWQGDALAEMSSYSGQENPETMSIVVDEDDSNEPEVIIADTPRHSNGFIGDVEHEKQSGMDSNAKDIAPEIDFENITDPQESLLGTEECFSPQYCIQTQDQVQEIPSEAGLANPITASAKCLPYQVSAQDVLVGVQDSSSEEALPCKEMLFPSSVSQIEAMHASLNDHISEPALSMDLINQENFLDVSQESMVPFSTPLHEAPQTDPEITPPLPPLPPTQWWMGKLVDSVKSTEIDFSPVPSLSASRTNSFYAHRDENTQNGLVQAAEAQYPSEESLAANGNHNFHVDTEESTMEAMLTAVEEPSKLTEEQSPAAVNGRSDTYMHNNGSTPKCLNKTAEETFASVSLRTTEAATESESVEGFEADWRVEAMALEWFSQNLREHANPNPAKVEEEEPQLDHPLEPYDQNENVGKLPRETDSLVIGIDRSMLRKVSEQERIRVGARVDENDSILEIIRSKSFNLRPAEASVRPNFQVAVPKTNLKVAAILEKASTLRQAMAGSDDDQDSDSWSE